MYQTIFCEMHMHVFNVNTGSALNNRVAGGEVTTELLEKQKISFIGLSVHKYA